MRMAKVFKSGNSQAIRIPKDFQFHSRKVRIAKEGNKIVLWEEPENLVDAFHLLASLPNDFFQDGRIDEPPQVRESL